MKTNVIITVSIIVYLFNPLLAIVMLTILGMSFVKNSTTKDRLSLLITYGIMCCTFVSLINMKIVPKADLEWYVETYSYASRIDLLPFLLISSDKNVSSAREPIYGVLVWCLNRLFNGNISWFKFTISMIEYTLMVGAVIYFGLKSKFKPFIIIVGIVFMCFYPYIFTSRLNIIRQSLANSLLLFIIVRRFLYEKKNWISLVAMPLVHTSSVLFLPLLFLPRLDKPFKKSWYLFLGILIPIVAYQFIRNYYMDVGFDFAGGDSSADAALDRAAKGAVGEYSLSLVNTAMSLIMLFSAIIFYRNKELIEIKGIRRFLSVFIISCIFVLVNMNNQFGARFYHYVLSFMPFLLMILFHIYKIGYPFILFLLFGIILFFTVYLHFGHWTYQVIAGGWIEPVFFYFI